ncbi:hypothetical protein HLB42_09660 [Deinococcus sp. D7000]|nr:hypothetical protein HLB42_09660 [Deinococcus sp. D7000]
MPKKNSVLIKRTLVERFGGGCQCCGYNRSMRALQFHHTDSSEKHKWSEGSASYAEVTAHPERFALLCANCHFEEHERLDALKAVRRTCLTCGEEFIPNNPKAQSRGKYCSKSCGYKAQMVLPDKAKTAMRIERRLEKVADCLVWMGSSHSGTPAMSFRSGERGPQPTPVSRVLYFLEHDVFPAGNLKRTCQTPNCVALHHRQLISRQA